MSNRIGKLLVLVNLAASMMFMTWALAIYMQKVDWGWKEPRKDITGTVRIPSEIDQRSAAVADAYQAIALILPDIKPVQAALAEAESRLAENHLWYRKELERLRSDPDAIEVKDVKYNKDGVPVLDTPGKALGKPVLGPALEGLDKSYEGYSKDLKKVQDDVKSATEEIQDWIGKEKKLTFNLNGKDDTGKVAKAGLYALLDNEAKAQAQVRFEKKYLEPLWVGALEEVELYVERRQLLETTLERLKKARTAKP